MVYYLYSYIYFSSEHKAIDSDSTGTDCDISIHRDAHWTWQGELEIGNKLSFGLSSHSLFLNVKPCDGPHPKRGPEDAKNKS